MTPEMLMLMGIAGLFALLAQSGILYASVGMAGGPHVDEHNSYLTAMFVTILHSVIGFGIRMLMSQHVIDGWTAFALAFACGFLVTMFAFGLGPLRALFVMVVASALSALIFFFLTLFTNLFNTFVTLARVFDLH